MHFTEAVLTECQRMCFVAPILGPRRTLADTTLGGYTIPKDTVVLMNILDIHMDPELYPEPTLFKPERFINDGVYQSDDNLLTFGKGRYFCDLYNNRAVLEDYKIPYTAIYFEPDFVRTISVLIKYHYTGLLIMFYSTFFMSQKERQIISIGFFS